LPRCFSGRCGNATGFRRSSPTRCGRTATTFACLVERLQSGGAYDAAGVAAKRRAETANSAVFSSLQRMTGDPKNRREGLEQAATLANGNQRLTRVLTVLTLQLTGNGPLASSYLGDFAQVAADALEELATTIEHGAGNSGAHRFIAAHARSAAVSTALCGCDRAAAQRIRWIFSQLTRAATELSALLLAIQETPLAEVSTSASAKPMNTTPSARSIQ